MTSPKWELVCTLCLIVAGVQCTYIYFTEEGEVSFWSVASIIFFGVSALGAAIEAGKTK